MTLHTPAQDMGSTFVPGRHKKLFELLRQEEKASRNINVVMPAAAKPKARDTMVAIQQRATASLR